MCISESWKASITSSKDRVKGKKTVFKIDFEEEIDFDNKFKVSKATALTKNCLNKYSKDQTTLPKDHHYDADKMFRLYMLKRRMVSELYFILSLSNLLFSYCFL